MNKEGRLKRERERDDVVVIPIHEGKKRKVELHGMDIFVIYIN